MSNITTISELNEVILLLESKQEQEGHLLKEQFKTVYENLKPINLVKDTLRELVSAPDFKGDLMNASLSIAAGYLSKKAVIGSTHNPIKQVLGTLLQMGVTSIVSNNSTEIKTGVKQLISKFFIKKEKQPYT